MLKSNILNYTNIVMIKTADSIGSGVIFPCQVGREEYEKRYDKNDLNKYNFYCIITNAHVVEHFISGRSSIRISAYDENNERIEICEEDIVEHHIGPDSIDIFAMLVRISCQHRVKINNKICMLNWESDGQQIYSKGFPGILQSGYNLIPITVTGTNQISYKLKQGIYTYRVNEDFHYYNGYSDENFYGGLSGGPVLIIKGNETALVGLNMYIEANMEGDNPYKLVNYISIKHIMDFLRMSGCIIFDIESGAMSLIWIKFEYIDKSDGEKHLDISADKAFLVLGSSGAGKSSFVNGLCKNTSDLFINGDGQTTRMDVRYFLDLYKCSPRIEINFYEEKQYVLERYKNTVSDVVKIIFDKRYGIDIDDIRIIQTDYLREHIRYMEKIIGFDSKGITEKSFDDERYRIDRINEICNSYDKQVDDVLYVSWGYFLFLQLLFFCQHKEEPLNTEQISYIFDQKKRNLELVCIKNLIEDEKLKKNADNEKLYESLKENTRISLKADQINLDDDGVEGYIEYIKREKQGNGGASEKEYGKDILQALRGQNGYFDFSEYAYLFDLGDSDEEYINWINNLRQEIYECKRAEVNERSKRDAANDEEKKIIAENEKIATWIENSIEFELKQTDMDGEYEWCFLNDIWTIIYRAIWRKIDEKFNGKCNKKKTVSGLLNMDRGELEFVNSCITVYKKRSLSSLVDSINIYDFIVDEYASVFYKNRVDRLLLIDTCGLDHVGKDRNIGSTLSKKVNKYSIVKINGKFYLNGIFYVKKLDSGHPTEIQDILTYVVDETNLAFYCIFNGSDIYEMTNGFFPENKDWHLENDDEQYPKAFRYVKEEMNSNQIFMYCKAGKYRKKRVFDVMSKNIITFCSNDQMSIVDKSKYKKNNLDGINTLLMSITCDELNFANYSEFDVDEYRKVLNDHEKELDKFIKIWFDYASMKNWNKNNYNTLRANIERISGCIRKESEPDVGHCGTYDFRWSNLFRSAFITVLNQYSAVFTRELKEFSEIAEKQLRSLYIDYDFFEIKYNCDKEETIQVPRNFNDIMRKLCFAYKKRNPEFINPFDQVGDEKNRIVNIKKEYEGRRGITTVYSGIMNGETDFIRIISECSEERHLFTELIINKMLEYYEKDNNNYLEIIKNRKPEWCEHIDNVIKQMTQYGYSEASIKCFIDGYVNEVLKC